MVGRCTRERRLIRSMGADTATFGSAARRDPRALNMSLRANVELRIDVAEIIRWIVIGYFLLN